MEGEKQSVRDHTRDGVFALALNTETFAVLQENSVIPSLGIENPAGLLSILSYWIMYNWYVSHNQGVDSFGICPMDRKAITEDFHRGRGRGEAAKE